MPFALLVRRVTGKGVGESARDLRPDIQALRAIAVCSVLLFHLWPVRVTGGYVGVDVFFVISGFLITSHLLREVDRSGRLRIGQFWTRRARRLLPSSLLVLLATVGGIALFAPASQWGRSLGDIVGSAFYVENWRLAALAVDYLGAEAAPSPVQHFWTLSVEEQFYVGLPLLLLAALWVSRVARLGQRAVIAFAIGAVAAASLTLSVLQTTWTASAYFTTHTRAWEFAIGALLAFLPPMARAAQYVTSVGVLGIAAAVFLFTGGTPFPGFAALLPVLGAALAVWAGRGTWLSWTGQLSPVAAVGRSSYAIYLWHWPIVVLVPYATGDALTLPIKIGIVVAALVLGWLTTVLWEEPVRFSTRLLGGRRPRVVAMWCAAATMLVVVAALSLLFAEESRRPANQKAVASAFAALEASGCAGAASMVNSACDPMAPAPVLIPALDALATDAPGRQECWHPDGSESLMPCQIGDGNGLRFLVLGDSHTISLLPAYEQLASEHGYTFFVSGEAGCYPTTASIVKTTEQDQAKCDTWRKMALKAIAAGDYDVLLVTHYASLTVTPRDGLTAEETAIAGMQEAWAMRPSVNTPVIAIRDNPVQAADPEVCLDREGPDGGGVCGRRADRGLLPDLQGDAAIGDPNGHVIDMSDIYCRDGYCPAILGGVVVYRDRHHLSATFVKTLTPILGDRLETILLDQGTLGEIDGRQPQPNVGGGE